jgi:cytochrome b561
MSTVVEVRTANANVNYDPVAKILHWLTVLLIVAQFVVAWTMPAIHKGVKPVGLIQWHLVIGSSLLIVVVLRLVWRLTHRPPPPAEGLPGWQRQTAAITHWALYVLLLAVPITGWAAASVRTWVVRAFGVLPLPQLLPTGDKIGFRIGDIHSGVLAWTLLGVAVLHILAALYHRLGLRDKVLSRML